MSTELERLFHSAPHPYLVVSTELRVLDVNACYLSTLRAQRDALLGRPIVEALAHILCDPSGDLVKELRDSLERVIRSAQQDQLSLRCYQLQDGGATRSLRLCHTPLLDHHGALTSILHSVEDLTDFGQPAEQRCADLLDSAPDGDRGGRPGRNHRARERASSQALRLCAY